MILRTNKLALILLILLISFLSVKCQIIYDFAGNGVYGYSGDGSSALFANLFYPKYIAVDGSGNIYIADQNNNRVRKVNTNGIITTVAGTGVAGYSGDGGLAINAEFNAPGLLVIDSADNIFIAGYGDGVIRKISQNGLVTTYAGGGTVFPGDGGLATNAFISDLQGITIDNFGNLYFSDPDNNTIRKVNSQGIISKFAGTGIIGFSGDGSLAINAQLNAPGILAIDNFGNLYVADGNNFRLRKISPAGIITTIVGTGTSGFSGDGGDAKNAQLTYINGLCFDNGGLMYISDGTRIRKIDASNIITTVSGSGTSGYSGNGQSFVNATYNYPSGIAFDKSGNFFIADRFNNRVREVCFESCLVGIENQKNENPEVQIFPNPNNGTFTFQMTDNKNELILEITDLLGNEVYTTITVPGKNLIQLNVQPGIYFCIVSSGQNNTKKYIKKISVE